MRKLLLLLFILAVGAGAAVLWLAMTENERPRELVLYGNVDLRQVDLAFEESARIDGMFVEEGSRVRAGELLATLETSRLARQVDQARSQVEARQATLTRLENGTRPEEIRSARAAVAEAKADADYAQSQFIRNKALFAQDAVAKDRLDDLQAAYVVAQARLKRTGEDLNLALQGPRWEEVAEARANLRAAEANQQVLEQRMRDSKLYAPSNGVIRKRVLEPGDLASAAKTVLTLALTDPKWVRAYVGEADLGRIRPGMRAEVTIDSAPDKPVSGWIGFISPMAEFTPRTVETEELRTELVYEVRVFVRDVDDVLRLGMPATIRLRPDLAPITVRPVPDRDAANGNATDDASPTPERNGRAPAAGE